MGAGRTVTGPLSRKLIEAVGRLRRDHPLIGFLEALRAVADPEKAAATVPSLRSMAPLHRVYVYAQNRVSELSEQATGLRVMRPFADLVGLAEEEYMPSGPPMSPLTASYFTSWAFFDAAVGASRESIGTCLIDLLRHADVPAGIVRVIQAMQDSRMGFYVQEARDGRAMTFREIPTGRLLRATVPTQYPGHQGEVWFVRIVPPLWPGSEEHLVFTTPYVMRELGEGEWRAYLDRTLSTWHGGHEALLKYGPSPCYWNEFIFEAYCGHEPEVVFLMGLPDVAKSRPHSRENL